MNESISDEEMEEAASDSEGDTDDIMEELGSSGKSRHLPSFPILSFQEGF